MLYDANFLWYYFCHYTGPTLFIVSEDDLGVCNSSAAIVINENNIQLCFVMTLSFSKTKICTNTKKPRPHMPRKYAHVVYCNLGIKLTQRHIMFLWRHSSPRRVEEENRNEVSSVFNIFSPLSTLEGKRPLRPPLVRANAARRGRQGLPAPAGAQVGRFAAMSTKMASVAWLTLVLLWRLLVVLELDL